MVMKKAMSLFLLLLIAPLLVNTQTIENLDYISPFHDGFAAVKKDNLWAFINTNGEIVINFRNDLVATNSEDGNYPIFIEGKCLIEKKIDGISYYGFIDTSGKIVVTPQFLNVSNYLNNVALAIILRKEVLGKNEVLNKNLISYKYYEVSIDSKGNIIKYLSPKGVVVVIDKNHTLKTPKITSKRISENLCAVIDDNNQWALVKVIE